MRGVVAIGVALVALVPAAPAGAQLPVPIPPIGPPPPEQPPPPQNQPPAAQPLGSPPTGSVTVGVNAAHDGFVDDPNLVPPLQRRWSREFDDDLGPVRAADGRLYTLATAGGTYALRALDPLTGHDLWARAIPKSANLVYDGGRLFAIGIDGMMRAFSAADGSPLWERNITQGSASPVATGGAVYVTAKGALLALNGADGSELWKVNPFESDTVPAVDDDRVYIANACEHIRAYARADGKSLWQRTSDCGGGGDITPSLFGANLFVPPIGAPGTGFAFDRATGADAGTFFGEARPTFARGVGLFRHGGTVIAKDMASGKTRWTHPGESDEQTAPPIDWLSPVAVYHSVYRLAPNGLVYALSLETGKRIWHARASMTGPVTGQTLEVAPGLLLAPTGKRLTAYGSLYRPAPGGIAFAPLAAAVEYPHRTFVDGVIGSGLRGPRAHVRLDYDEQPFGRFRRGTRGSTTPDGFFSYTVRPDLNTRIRFRSGKARSGVRTMYVYPRVRYKFARPSPSRIRATVRVRTASIVRLAGRPASLYLVRVKQRRFDRLDTARLHSARRGRSSTTFGFRALRHVGKRDLITACIKGQPRIGLGPPTRFLRRCGARRIRY